MKCPVCGAKSPPIGALKTSATAHAITSQCNRTVCGHRWTATLTAARVYAPQSAPAGQIETPAQAPGSGAPSRASQRRKRRLLAKNKGKMPMAPR